jgi:hypothetical protein
LYTACPRRQTPVSDGSSQLRGGIVWGIGLAPAPKRPSSTHAGARPGEVGITAAAAAIASAIHDASGRCVVELPIAIDKLL